MATVVLTVALILSWRARQAPLPPGEATHVGSARCAACHAEAFSAWQGSHHARSMQPALDGTVLGDFSGAVLAAAGQHWRFRRDGARFLAIEERPGAEARAHEIAYAFGVEPLQQYLIAFPGGRLQCLPAAWDVRARRWFLVARRPNAAEGDWLHWTRQGQNWNSMCADCHSTAVRKGYDPVTGRYDTTFAEVEVGCEACHGPASRHVAWAERPALLRGALEDAGLATRTAQLTAPAQIALCAPCHARRAQFADQGRPGGELLDRYLPDLLEPGVFHGDGQIEDEDFELQAFSQSRMHAGGVRCGDCHDVHSGRRRREGNALCTRCHAASYDSKAHHFHQASWQERPSAGALCVSCHMPTRVYMGVHVRRDHSLRIPRPALSRSLGAPDACSASGCHADRPAAWIDGALERWYGPRPPPPHAVALAAGRRAPDDAVPDLARLAADRLRPAFARATALQLLGGAGGDGAATALERALSAPEPLLRLAAATHLDAPADRLAASLGPLLLDPVRAVRQEAAARLAGPPSSLLPPSLQAPFARALDEYQAAQRYMSDQPGGAFQLASLAAILGRPEEAETGYRRALTIDGAFQPARVNLALLLAGTGRAGEAERLLREALAAEPGAAAVALDLGLLLAEQGRRAAAEKAFKDALAADPRLALAAFNLAILAGERSAAEALPLARQAAAIAPGEPRFAEAVRYYQAGGRSARRP